jgi:hypothetical protein
MNAAMNASRRVRRTAGLVAGLLILLGSSAGAARPDGGPGSRHVAFSTTTQFVGFDSACDPTVPTRCAGTFRSIRTFTGDFSGTAYVVGSAVLLADGTYQGQDVSQFTGTINGCGGGTLLIIETGILEPASGTERGSWAIVAGQGTGDLSRVSGEGTADSSAGGATGTLRCR